MVDNHNLMDLMEEYITECQIRKLSPVTIKEYLQYGRANSSTRPTAS